MNIEIAIDINEPALIIPFYARLLGYQTDVSDETRYGSDRTYFSLTDPTGTKPTLIFQVVPEKPTSKNRIHLDFHVVDIESNAALAIEFGATRIDVEPISEVGATWIRLADPEGNIFCFVQSES